VRDELLERDNVIAKLESELGGVKQEIQVKVSTIANLQNKLSGVTLEIEAREVAIAKLKSELTAAGNIKQLPAAEPEPMPTPEPTPEPVLGTVELLTVDTSGLVKYINSIEPGSGIKAKTIGNAINRKNNGKDDGEGGKGKNLSSLESTYNFKHLGKVGNSHKFSIPNL
jgi:secreted protein with Ig-like and vWFA domain